MAQRSRRLRKKLRIEEFQELGFEVSWNFPASSSEEAIDSLIDRLAEQNPLDDLALRRLKKRRLRLRDQIAQLEGLVDPPEPA